MIQLPYGLEFLNAGGGKIAPIEGDAYRLSIPEGPEGRYRLAQLDNYGHLKRRDFPHRAPCQIQVEMRACAESLPGTWGFGIWNDPFGMGLLALVSPGLALMLNPAGRRLLRRLGRKIVQQDTVRLEADPSEWHEYKLEWKNQQDDFYVDGVSVLGTKISPQGRLGLVIWIDNQYASLPPDGRFKYGMQSNEEPAWIEMRRLIINH
jgi:hypothetical protein